MGFCHLFWPLDQAPVSGLDLPSQRRHTFQLRNPHNPHPNSSFKISYTFDLVEFAQWLGERKNVKQKKRRRGKKKKQQSNIISQLWSQDCFVTVIWVQRRWGAVEKQHFRQEMSIIQKCNIIMCLDGPVYQTAFSGKDVGGVGVRHVIPFLPRSSPARRLSSTSSFFFPFSPSLQDTSNFPGFATTYMSFLSVFI